MATGVLLVPVLTSSIDRSDFRMFYHGATVVGSPDLYRSSAVPASASPYVRPPFYGLLLKPLTTLEIKAAFAVWQAVNFGAVVLFFLLWTERTPRDAMTLASFVPLWTALYLAQDTPIILCLVAVGWFLLDRKKYILAGFVLSILTQKLHVLFFLPLAFVKHRRALLSFFFSGLAWFLLSAWLAGFGWPFEMASLSLAHDRNSIMRLVSVRSLVYPEPTPAGVAVLAVMSSLLLLVLFANLRADAKTQLGVCIFVSVCLSHHALIYDAALALPLLLSHSWSKSLPITNMAIGVAAVADGAAARTLFWGIPIARSLLNLGKKGPAAESLR